MHYGRISAVPDGDAPASGGSRFAGLGRWSARLILILLAIAILHGVSTPSAPVPAREVGAADDMADADLYARIVTEVRAGGDYHQVAARAQREGNYPLRPFFTMRLPTLAWLQAALPGSAAASILLHLLLAATAAVWALRLRADGMAGSRAVMGALLLLAGSATLRLPVLLNWHEGWAALLIALSLALRTDGKLALSLGFGLAAVLIRELAILYPVAMAAAALHGGRLREAACWSAILPIFGAYLAWHAGEVAAVVRPGDPASPGWSAAGGWRFFLSMMWLTGPLRSFPAWTAALLVPLSLLGWAGWRSGLAVRGTLMLGAFAALFACFGRPENFYWGFLIAPLLPLGLLFAPGSLRDLARAARPRSSQR